MSTSAADAIRLNWNSSMVTNDNFDPHTLLFWPNCVSAGWSSTAQLILYQIISSMLFSLRHSYKATYVDEIKLCIACTEYFFFFWLNHTCWISVVLTCLRLRYHEILRTKKYELTFRHRASCILGQAFHYSPENAFYIFNQQIYFIIWYLLDRASLI